ncbi:hypothetical protein [Janthinobacterium sp. NKUCC06_STL]|uniref:hypothetical protein n=1 Tax=Janthinobacterium sp. NKUCC06_STL TaxID=2842127 RepID=UPI00214AFBB4|nr:hypothetical protein [Janthinobacterium sp. NKUCC06_STL]
MKNREQTTQCPDDVDAKYNKMNAHDYHGAAALLDWLLVYMGLRNDACLARELGVPPFTIGKLRTGASTIDADMLIRMHEASALGIVELRAGMGDHRRRFHC